MVTGSGHNDGTEDALGTVIGQLAPLAVIIVPYALHERPAENVHRGAVDLRLLHQPRVRANGEPGFSGAPHEVAACLSIRPRPPCRQSLHQLLLVRWPERLEL